MTGKTSKWLSQTLEFHTSRLFSLKRAPHQTCTDWLPIKIKSQLKEPQPCHPLSPSLEEKSNGWIMLKTLMTGKISKWLSQTLEFHTSPQFSSVSKLLSSLMNKLLQTSTDWQSIKIKNQLKEPQPCPPHNLSSVAKSNGWTTLPTSKSGAINRSR